jgi:hypothetical protein
VLPDRYSAIMFADAERICGRAGWPNCAARSYLIVGMKRGATDRAGKTFGCRTERGGLNSLEESTETRRSEAP